MRSATLATTLLLSILMLSPVLAQGQQMRVPLAPGAIAPDFTATTLDGATVSLSQWHGKVVVLNYFITWYRDAAEHLELMEALNTAFSGQGMRLLSISLDEGAQGAEDVRTLVHDEALAQPVVLDPEQRIAELYGVRALPAIFIIDRSGHIALYHEGYNEGDDEVLGEAIAATLAAPTSEGAGPAPPPVVQPEPPTTEECPPAAPEEPAPADREQICHCFRETDQ